MEAQMSRDSHLPTLFGRASLVSDGHTTLKDSARALRDLCEGGASADAQRDSDLAALVEAFAVRVLSHFEVEESGAYFDTLAEDSPELSSPIAQLKNEHGSMRITLRGLREFPVKSPPGSLFVVKLARFLDEFEAHEEHERRVLERYFLK
jgi:hemerythrin-like domain-containing protein